MDPINPARLAKQLEKQRRTSAYYTKEIYTMVKDNEQYRQQTGGMNKVRPRRLKSIQDTDTIKMPTTDKHASVSRTGGHTPIPEIRQLSPSKTDWFVFQDFEPKARNVLELLERADLACQMAHTPATCFTLSPMRMLEYVASCTEETYRGRRVAMGSASDQDTVRCRLV